MRNSRLRKLEINTWVKKSILTFLLVYYVQLLYMYLYWEMNTKFCTLVCHPENYVTKSY